MCVCPVHLPACGPAYGPTAVHPVNWTSGFWSSTARHTVPIVDTSSCLASSEHRQCLGSPHSLSDLCLRNYCSGWVMSGMELCPVPFLPDILVTLVVVVGAFPGAQGPWTALTFSGHCQRRLLWCQCPGAHFPSTVAMRNWGFSVLRALELFVSLEDG